MKLDKDIIKEGREAFFDNKSIDANPYQSRGIFQPNYSRSWLSGYIKAKSEKCQREIEKLLYNRKDKNDLQFNVGDSVKCNNIKYRNKIFTIVEMNANKKYAKIDNQLPLGMIEPRIIDVVLTDSLSMYESIEDKRERASNFI